jgi:hypothetical protein
MIKQLEQLAYAPDVEQQSEAIKALFKQIVPTYQWQPKDEAQEHALQEMKESLAEAAAHKES